MVTSELPDRGLGSGAAHEGDDDRASGHAWVLRLWLLVGVFVLVTAARSIQVGIPPRDPHLAFFGTRIAISLGIFAVYVAGQAAWVARREGRLDRAHVLEVVRRRWSRRRLTLALSALLAYHVTYFCYHNLKSWDVFNAPKDAMLLHWDRVLFFGHSPAVLLHDLLGQHYAAYVLMLVYESFGTMVLFAIPAPLVFVSRIRDGYVAITAACWVWMLGVGSYYLIPTLGPFWSAPQEFAGLPHTMIQDTQAHYFAQRQHLLAFPHAHDAFAQISAFASLHVAVTTLILLMVRYYGHQRLYRAYVVFLAGTFVATVYLGWHFFVDDVAGFLIAALSVWVARRMVYPDGRDVASRRRAAATASDRA